MLEHTSATTIGGFRSQPERCNNAYYWQRTRRHNPLEARKRGPKTAFSDKELTERLRKEIAASPFTGEGQRKFWARLRIAGVRTSKARVLRLMRDAQMRDAQMRAPQRQAAPVAEKVHTGTIVTEHPNQMWGIDATATVTIEGGPGHRVRRGRSLHCGVCRHPCGQTGDSF